MWCKRCFFGRWSKPIELLPLGLFDNATRLVPELTKSRLLLVFVAIHELQISYALNLLSVDLGHWVKLKKIIEFSKNLLIEFNDNRWVESFRMNKLTLFNVDECLRHVLQKQNIKYHKAIIVKIWVCCSIHKLVQDVNFLICKE